MLIGSACTIAPAPENGFSAVGSQELPPAGFGTMLQDEVTISLVSRGLEIKAIPLDEAVTRVTAPDTYARLSGIADASRSSAPPGSSLFVVSFYSVQADLRFIPEDVQFISRGLRMRSLAILPITPSWGQRRVQQQQTEMAVYAFSGDLDLGSDLILAYGLEQTSAWSGILPRVQAERGRTRARSGIGR
ncbi:MAG: hypothetical protein OSA81_09765 [Longimicrobiales bacterium]|nr:hypothetical protein [Longimicrobiales bacterium]